MASTVLGYAKAEDRSTREMEIAISGNDRLNGEQHFQYAKAEGNSTLIMEIAVSSNTYLNGEQQF